MYLAALQYQRAIAPPRCSQSHQPAVIDFLHRRMPCPAQGAFVASLIGMHSAMQPADTAVVRGMLHPAH